MIQPFTEEDFRTLDGWLQRRHTGLCDIVELEGFLTAIVIGPHTLSPSTWLPKVWGGQSPHFKDLAEMNRFMALVMGYYNDIVSCFETDPAAFQPTFYESKAGKKKFLIVDEWCFGFMKGTKLDAAGWKPLMKERPELLKPMQLFGTRAGWKELKAGGDAKMHATWSVRIAPAVRGIHAFWLPYRRNRPAIPSAADQCTRTVGFHTCGISSARRCSGVSGNRSSTSRRYA